MIISDNERSIENITGLLRANPTDFDIFCVKNGEEARHAMQSDSFEGIIAIAPLPDELGDEVCIEAVESTDAGVLLILKSKIADDVAERLENAGVIVLEKPLSEDSVRRAVRVILAQNRRITRMHKKTRKLETELEEIKLINRAKWALIEQLNMTETQAHRYIEKQAMDTRQSRMAVAKNILMVYVKN